MADNAENDKGASGEGDPSQEISDAYRSPSGEHSDPALEAARHRAVQYFRDSGCERHVLETEEQLKQEGFTIQYFIGPDETPTTGFRSIPATASSLPRAIWFIDIVGVKEDPSSVRNQASTIHHTGQRKAIAVEVDSDGQVTVGGWRIPFDTWHKGQQVDPTRIDLAFKSARYNAQPQTHSWTSEAKTPPSEQASEPKVQHAPHPNTAPQHDDEQEAAKQRAMQYFRDSGCEQHVKGIEAQLDREGFVVSLFKIDIEYPAWGYRITPATTSSPLRAVRYRNIVGYKEDPSSKGIVSTEVWAIGVGGQDRPTGDSQWVVKKAHEEDQRWPTTTAWHLRSYCARSR